jgi:dTDP-4-amino-4,6-dideoxygalactose transaminase
MAPAVSAGLCKKVKVPFFDLSGQHQTLRPEIDAAIGRVLDSGQFILGPPVQELEQGIAAYVRKRFAVGVSSGTDALLLSLMALGVGPGDVVLTTPFSFFATAGTIARLGAIPLLADIEPTTFNLDPAQAEKALSAFLNQDPGLYPPPSESGLQGAERRTPAERLKAILPVHLYGQAANMPALNRLAHTCGLRVVEDAAQAIGVAFPEPEGGGSFRDNLVCYSFYPTKNLGGMGDAGMAVTDNPESADKLRRIRVHGAQSRYVHDLIGGNFRLDSLQAAILAVKLNYLDHWTRRRQENAGYYETLFGQTDLAARGLVRLPPAVFRGRPGLEKGYHIYNQYVLRVKDRAGLQSFLARQGVGTEIYYPLPFHLQPCFHYLDYHFGDFPEAEKAAQEVLALPIFPELTRDQQQYVVEKITQYYEGGKIDGIFTGTDG